MGHRGTWVSGGIENRIRSIVSAPVRRRFFRSAHRLRSGSQYRVWSFERARSSADWATRSERAVQLSRCCRASSFSPAHAARYAPGIDSHDRCRRWRPCVDGEQRASRAGPRRSAKSFLAPETGVDQAQDDRAPEPPVRLRLQAIFSTLCRAPTPNAACALACLALGQCATSSPSPKLRHQNNRATAPARIVAIGWRRARARERPRPGRLRPERKRTRRPSASGRQRSGPLAARIGQQSSGGAAGSPLASPDAYQGQHDWPAYTASPGTIR